MNVALHFYCISYNYFKEKVHFWPSNYGSSLVLALQLENQTPAVPQLSKPFKIGPRAHSTAVSAQ